MSTISPVIRYQDAYGAIAWLVGVFGFTQQSVHAAPDGSVAHAELSFGPSLIGVSSASATPTDHPWSKVRQGLYVTVKEVDAHHARAAAAGAKIASPLQDMDYGSREYAAWDPGGHLWGFGTYAMGNKPDADAQPTIYPELHYQNGADAVAFLVRTFGFEKQLEVPGPDGDIMHAELRFGPGIVMVGGGDEGAEIWGGLKQCQHVWLEAPDAHYANAKAAGATIVQEPRDTPWGSRGYYVRDTEGLLWGFSTYRP